MQRNDPRGINLKNGAQINDRFIVWDENQRMGFCVTESTIGGIERFGELYDLPETTDGCHLRWTFAVEMQKWWQRWLLLLLWLLMYLALQGVLKSYAHVAVKHGPKALATAQQEQRALEHKTRQTAADILAEPPLN